MEEKWFYAPDGARQGPVSRDELQLALNEGKLDRDTLVWRQGMETWQTLETVEELRSLLEALPPPLPEAPPPLPPPMPAASPAAAPAPPPLAAAPAPAAEAGAGEKKDEEKKGGKLKETLVSWFHSSVKWLADKLWDELKAWVSRSPAKAWSIILAAVVSTTTAVVVVVNAGSGGGFSGNGQIRIDANPWGQVEWIRGEDGTPVTLPGERTTPLSMALPAGTYRAQVQFPAGQVTKTCSLHVKPGELAACWLDLAPVDAKSYFEKIGW